MTEKQKKLRKDACDKPYFCNLQCAVKHKRCTYENNRMVDYINWEQFPHGNDCCKKLLQKA